MKGPNSRTDSYMGAIKEKFKEIADVIKNEGITAVFHGGDLFDKPVVSLTLTGDIAKIILETGVPWYVVPGNHDLFGYNIKSLPQTSLGLLSQAGVIQILDRNAGAAIFTTNVFDPTNSVTTPHTISFEGQEYHMNIDHQDVALDYWVEDSADVNVLIPHSMLLDKEYFPEVPYTHTSDLKNNTTADLILVGHYHDGYNAHIIQHDTGNYTHVFNPGSMTRDEGSKGNLTRRPQYVILEFTDKYTWSYQAHEFTCAAAGVDIFDRSHITNKQAKDKYLQSFEQKLSDVKLDAVDVRDVLDKMIVADGAIDKEIAEEARNRLVEAEQVIDDVAKQMTGYVEKPANIFISKIHVKGFQSHEDTTIDLSPGFNAIIGPSDSGKSSLLRSLRFALYNEPKGSDFIRQSSSEAECSVYFSDGSSLTRTRTKASAGRYVVRDGSGIETELKGFSNNVPVDVPNTHQMPQIQLTKDLESSLNMGYQLDQPFLIGESPGTRAAIIGRLTGVNLVDTAVRETGKDILGNTRDIKVLAGQVTDVETQISQFTHLPSLEETIKSITGKISEVELSERWKSEYEDIAYDLATITTQEEALTQELAEQQKFLKLAPLVSQLESKSKSLQELTHLDSAYKKTVAEESLCTTAIIRQEEILLNASFLPVLESDILMRRKLATLRDDFKKVATSNALIYKEVANMPRESLHLEIKILEGAYHRLSDYSTLQLDIQENQLQIDNFRKQIRLAYTEEGNALKEHQQLLEDNGTCPTCNQIIQRGHLHVNN
jgi:exonuclease SbcC